MRWLAIAIVLAGCAHEVNELTPFACPENHECPDGFVCAGNECVEPEPDRECYADFENNCSAIGPGYACEELAPVSKIGICTQSCEGDNDCADDHKCGPGGLCMRDCSAVNDCRPGTECTGIGGRLLCLPSASPKVGELCRNDGMCQLRGLAGKCAAQKDSLGSCFLTCTDDAGCIADIAHAGRICAATADLGADSFCFEACDATPCADTARDECKMASDGVRKICVPKATRLPLGQLCGNGLQCASNSCGRLSTTGEKRCVDSCAASACPVGFACLAGELGIGQCWPTSDGRDAGCSATGASGGTLWLGAVALWGLRRRRRDRA